MLPAMPFISFENMDPLIILPICSTCSKESTKLLLTESKKRAVPAESTRLLNASGRYCSEELDSPARFCALASENRTGYGEQGKEVKMMIVCNVWACFVERTLFGLV